MSAEDGKPCKKCGTSEWGNRGRCKQCARDNAAKWRRDNPERHRENSRRWAQENPEAVKKNKRQYGYENAESLREYKRRWAQENSQTVKKNKRRWYEANVEAVKEQSRRRYKENTESIKENVRRWARENPDAARASKQRHRARVKGNGGAFTAAEWRDLVESCGNRCLCCGRTDVKLTVDHVIPVALGGTNDIDNIQPLCLSCNASKNTKHIDYRPKPGILRWIQKKLFD